MATKVIEAGTILSCPKCEKEMYELTVDISSDDQHLAENLEPASIVVALPYNGMLDNCPFCKYNGASYTALMLRLRGDTARGD